MDDLTPEELERFQMLVKLDIKTIERLKKVAETDERVEWLWASIRKIVTTITIIIGGFVLFYDQLRSFVKSLVGG